MVDVSFSGYVMPVERMPFALQMLAQVFPLQHYLVVIRSIMLKGATLPAIWNQALALGALSVGSIGIAAVSVRTHLE
jgi:ABC-2 type transport system permease protein